MLPNAKIVQSTEPSPSRQLTACFRSPGPKMLGNNLASVLEQIAVDPAFAVPHAVSDQIAGMTTTDAEAIAHVIPYLLCGEESAVIVFYREGRRMKHKANAAAQELMWRVSGEEKVHETMLARLASELPESDSLAATRSSGHEFFVGMADSDPGVHFARVAALDSGVCKIMAALCASPAVNRCPAAHRIFSKVRNDEARHVRISRQYVADLGLPSSVLNDAADFVCPGLGDFIFPSGNAFEKMGIDFDRLIRRVRREEV